MPSLPPPAAAWEGHGDPHGVTAGLMNGRTPAFLLASDRSLIARVDMQGVAAIMAGTSTAPFTSQVALISVPPPP